MRKSKCKYCIECVTYYEETDTFRHRENCIYTQAAKFLEQKEVAK